MELLQEGIIYLEERLREIRYELNWNKALKLIFWSILVALIVGMAVIFGMILNDLPVFAVTCNVIRVALIVVSGLLIWTIKSCALEELNMQTNRLKCQKYECERDIEKYKNDMIDLREMEKKVMKSKTILTEKQIDTLSYYTEKAKQVFKWLIVTKDGEVVASDIKPEYNEEYDTWFFDNEANTIQIGRNKKLAKKSKHTLTKIISGGYTSLGI